MPRTVLLAVKLFVFAWMLFDLGGAAEAAEVPERLRRLPSRWTVTSTTAPFEREIAGHRARITNTSFSVGGRPIKINMLACPTEAAAIEVQRALLKAQSGILERCPREQTVVFEFVGNERGLVEQAYLDGGFGPPKVTYDVRFSAAPITGCDPMAWNQMFNLFLAPEPDDRAVRELAKRFTFGDRFWVRTHGLGASRSLFVFEPKARPTAAAAGDGLASHTFARLPEIHGIGQVRIEAVITSEAFAPTPTTRQPGADLLAATAFWPTTDRAIVDLAGQITGGRRDPDQVVAALLEWFRRPENVKYGGAALGSRYGVLATLRQRFGRCWDFSDLFITLSRAAGVPTRQVFGWMHGESGHVWAEVLLPGRGWRQVDPTAGGGCDSRYVPWTASEDGNMPLVYTSPVIVTPRAGADPH